MSPIPWETELRAVVESEPSLGASWLAEDRRAMVTMGLEQAFEAFPFGEGVQEPGLERIRRSIPVAVGTSRSPRLVDQPQPIVFMFDPEAPSKVFAALGGNLPPMLWPSAEATREGMLRDLAPYLDPPFRSAHRFSKIVRLGRGSLEELGFQSIDELVDVIAATEWWFDSRARWRSKELDDPWPADPTTASMLDLRVIEERAGADKPGARQSIAMRTLWSRSILIVEETRYGGVVFEMRYEPAPFVAALPAAGGGELSIPRDLPADLIASVVRSGTMTEAHLDERMTAGFDAHTAISLVEMRTGEPATFEALRKMIHTPETRDMGIALSLDEGARGLLYELECDTYDDTLRAQLAERLAFKVVGGEGGES